MWVKLEEEKELSEVVVTLLLKDISAEELKSLVSIPENLFNFSGTFNWRNLSRFPLFACQVQFFEWKISRLFFHLTTPQLVL